MERYYLTVLETKNLNPGVSKLLEALRENLFHNSLLACGDCYNHCVPGVIGKSLQSLPQYSYGLIHCMSYKDLIIGFRAHPVNPG